MKKYMKIHVILFKNWKHVFKYMYQMGQRFSSSDFELNGEVGENGPLLLFLEKICSIPLFLKYVEIYHIFWNSKL